MTATYEKIATQTLGSAAATVTFSSIPSTYTDLVLISDNIGTDLNSVYLYYNTTTGTTNYSATYINGNGSIVNSARTTNAEFMQCGVADTTRNNFIINIMNYANTNTFKTMVSRGNTPSFASRAFVGLWRSTSAITSITITNPGSNFAATSMFTLYGIKAA